MIEVLKGSILAYKFFDIADEIYLKEIVRNKEFRHPGQRIKISRHGLKSVAIENPPLTLKLGNSRIEWKNQRFTATVTARLYEFGTLGLLFKIPLENVKIQGLEKWLDFLIDPVFEKISKDFAEQLLKELSPFLVEPEIKEETEEYLIYFFERLSDSIEEFKNSNFPALLYGESEEFSKQILEDLLRHTYSYSKDDLAVIGWEAAIVYEPTGSMEIPDILEFAHVQLLELSLYDDIIDRELAKTYERIEEIRGFRWLQIGKYRGLMKQLLLRQMDIAQVIEGISNAIKVTGDVYYAKIYKSAQEVFRSREQIANIQRKMEMFNNIYRYIGQEIETARAEFLEFAILLLIFVEIILTLFLR